MQRVKQLLQRPTLSRLERVITVQTRAGDHCPTANRARKTKPPHEQEIHLLPSSKCH
ncbi:hypothetical protein DPMN_028552 [Dreissena polymorpha]|uniref:Uncharacterized protein n=1 Tax=Dreissena polymorpha TaxID=45954 RepID=A0A9D4RFF8_DREPO|nr:hypothetical protein DPMN_028552 [Dreissena polymorpha]